MGRQLRHCQFIRWFQSGLPHITSACKFSKLQTQFQFVELVQGIFMLYQVLLEVKISKKILA